MKSVFNRLSILLTTGALIVAQVIMPTQAAFADNNGTLQQVFCNIQGNSGKWKAQIGGTSTEHESPLKDVQGNNVYVHDQSDVTNDLDAACQAQYGTLTPIAPTVTPICGADNDTVILASTAHISYSQTGWSNGSNTVTAVADAGYVLTQPSSWTLHDNATAGCVTEDIRVTPVAPTVKDITKCGEYGSIVFAKTEGVTYTLTAGDGLQGAYTVTATANVGYVIAQGALTTFSGNLGVYNTCEEVVTCPKNTEWSDTNHNQKVDQGECYKKVFVCKYVGTPGIDERLQTGDNPVSVSVNAIKDFNGEGSYFNDAQGRSFVLEFDVGQAEPSVDKCPSPEEPAQTPPKEVFTPATCLKQATVTVNYDSEKYIYTLHREGYEMPVVLESGETVTLEAGTYEVNGYAVTSDEETELVYQNELTVTAPNGCGGITETPEIPLNPIIPAGKGAVMPTELPETGTGSNALFIGLAAAAVAYGAVYFAQPKRRYE